MKTSSSLYWRTLSSVSAVISREWSTGKMKFDAWPVEPPGLGSGPLSSCTMSVQPSRARWQARRVADDARADDDHARCSWEAAHPPLIYHIAGVERSSTHVPGCVWILLACSIAAQGLPSFSPSPCLALGGTASAADPAIVIGADGATAPVFSYADAIRERVFIPVPGVDQDLDGVVDRTAIDIIRPAESNAGLKVPAIIDAEPVLHDARPRQRVRVHRRPRRRRRCNDRWPLFYDNYFVPRGYAVILRRHGRHRQLDRLPDHTAARATSPA